MGEQLAADGITTVGVIYQQSFCAPGIPESLATAFGREGGEVVSTTSFAPTATDLSTQVAEVVAAKPDAVVVISDTGAQLAVPGLVAGGYQGDKLYFVGLALSDHSADFPAGSLVGSTASQPGLDIGDLTDFTDRILQVAPTVTDFSYAAESYDAVILSALAALAAGGTTGEQIASKLQEVSGGSGDGTTATDFASAARVIRDGGTVDYDGPSGPVTFDDNGDPTDAMIGIYRYAADNTFTRID
jgi:branched-chain amino acid transport system substrate-binding protein